MAKRGPGRAHREGMTVIQLLEAFPDDAAAEAWFEAQRWPDGRFCPDCGSTNTVATKARKPMPYRCRACRAHFSVRKGTVMQASPLGLRKWVIALYLMSTGIKGTSSMKLYREIGIRQATARSMMQRIREAFAEGDGLPFQGPVEVDESHFGGKEKNKHAAKKLRAGRGAVGKATVAGARDRATTRVSAKVVKGTDRATLQGFVGAHAAPGATVYPDEHGACRGLPFAHKTVKHSVGEYVNEAASTNGIERFWALLKRGYHGTFHHLSEKHLGRYVREFAGRHNIRDLDTIEHMAVLARGMVGKRLRYRDLTCPIAH